jgi:replicative DNA helicase
MRKTDDTKGAFAEYGTGFQEALVRIILDDRNFADRIGEALDVNYLELKYLQIFVNKVYEYKKKYNVHPSRDTMTTLLRTTLDGETEIVQTQVRDYFARLLAASVLDKENDAYVCDTALEFCRKQKVKEAMLRCVPLLKTASFDEVSRIINKALQVGADNDIGYDYVADFEARFQKEARNPLSTGWEEIDKILNGGHGKGELGVVLAPTGGMKSFVLVHLGAAALRQGKTVIHYTLELRDKVIGSRYDSCFTGIPIDDLGNFKDRVLEMVQKIPGKLIIKQYPTKSASLHTIRLHLNKLLSKNVKPELVIIDYADLLRPTTSHKEKRDNLEATYEDMRGMAEEYVCPFFTASQCNRSSLNAEIITMEAIAEAFSKCFPSDFIFSLSRTIEDKQTNTGRIFIAKNRNGPDGIVLPVFADPAIASIKILPKTANNGNIAIEAPAQVQEKRLREKYKSFKKNKKQNGGEK